MVVGLTGGIGSGKSYILEVLKEQYNAIVLETDLIAKNLQKPGFAGYDCMVDILGETIIMEESGELDRKKMAEIMFANQALIEKVNSAIHPLVTNYICSIIDKTEYNNLVVVESAILFEAGLESLCDTLVFVQVEKEQRIKRLMVNRGYSREKCEQIMNQQMSDLAYLQLCEYVIQNNGEKETLRKEVLKVFDRIMER